MKAGYGKTVRPVCAADGGKLFTGRLLRPDSYEADEQRGVIRRGVGGAKGRDRGECGPIKRALDSEPDKRVTGCWLAYGAFCRRYPRWEKLWGGRRRSWHFHRPHELMEVAPWPKSMISAEA